MPYFFTCKQVSQHLWKEDYDKLPPIQKLSLKVHVILCPVCGAYNTQMMKFQDMIRKYKAREEKFLESEDPGVPHLAEDRREEIKKRLCEERERQAQEKE